MPPRRYLPALLLALPLLAYIAYPLAAMLIEAFTLPVAAHRAADMGWPLEQQPAGAPLRRAFAEPALREAAWGTLKLAVLTVLLSGAWGLSLVLLWWRREFPGRRYFALCGYAPLVMPPLVGTLAFFRLIGESGTLWRILPFNEGRPWVSGFSQVLLLHAYSFGVYTYAYVSAALADNDPSREEAARSLGAGTFRTFWTAVVPVIRAPLLASSLLVFMASAASFSAPYFLDNGSRYLTVEIFRNDDDPGVQRALSVLLAAIAFLALPPFLLLQNQITRATDAALSLKGSSRQQRPRASFPGQCMRVLLSLLALTVLFAPPLTVIFNAFWPTPNASGGLAALVAHIGRDDVASLGRSALYGAIAAAIDIFLAVSIAIGLRRAASLAALPVEASVMLAVALPGSVIGVALLSAFNAPSLLTFGTPLGGSAAILILAYVIRDLPLAVRPARAAIAAIGGDVERAASSLGANWATVLRRVTLPLMFPSLLAAGLICFITGAGEFVASQLLFSAATRPVSVRIAELFRTDPAPAFALSLCLMLMSLLAIMTAGIIQRRNT
ncbi:MAG TPA: iron ABC transporter permease [Planctomycetota bacterium]|nr:iron ABC transporter permease [Planctomycetota bacterium]